MTIQFHDGLPIYIQIKQYIADSIIKGMMEEGERIPSTNEFAKFYKINPATAAKGVNELVNEGVLQKRRGVGMFVKEGARERLLQERRRQFFSEYVLPLKDEAERLNISTNQLIKMIIEDEEGI